jgi:hypothetical protein
MMLVEIFITAPRLSELFYDIESFRPPPRSIGNPLRARSDPAVLPPTPGLQSPKRARTKPLWPPKLKPKAVDKGKAKVVDTGKSKKVKYPVMTGGDFKI